ncbi:hypothetical protein [Bradyrhizobium sp. BR 10289]|uniref:hypothetical protein n=1 Tax=Bradyrhizobium sp. BR 10289 TaxID=2749993 RepID=UPI001C64D102|nr:hypothetical protein [Bradyrhizobium sp. BR 10289]MBW7970963.1 hypothetical protein [Bradyrhizobium sp. BR 10289]
MDHLTTAGAGAAMTSPLWITTLNPYIQFTVAVLGAVWLLTKTVTTIYTTFFKKEIVSVD